MRFGGLATACAVLIVLSGLLYWSGHHKAQTTPQASGSSTTILKVDPVSITAATIKAKDGAPVKVVRQPSGQWEITQPEKLAADQNAIAQLLSGLSPLQAERVIETGASDLKAFGLDPPAVEIDITGKNHAVQKLLLGDNTPTSDAAYAMVAGNPRIFTTLLYNKTNLAKSLNDLRDKRLITMDSETMSRIDLTRDGQTIEFGRNAEGWQILEPGPYRADMEAANELADALAGAHMNLSESDDQDSAAAFARGTPVATAKVAGSAGTQSLEVRKDKDQYYAKSSIVAGAYAVDSSLAGAMNKKLDDFRDKQVFDFGYQDPNKVDLEINSRKGANGGTQSLDLVRSDQDWWWNGKKMNAENVENLISGLRDLTATKFADSGFAKPVIEATVISNDGKRVEKVMIAKSGSIYLAKRENEATLYVLDAGAVEGIRSVAEGLQATQASK